MNDIRLRLRYTHKTASDWSMKGALSRLGKRQAARRSLGHVHVLLNKAIIVIVIVIY